jgi:hypothetical protein
MPLRPFLLLLALLALLGLTLSHAQESETPEFQHGPRPPNSIFDPTSFLDPQIAVQIAEPLAKYRTNESIDVIVVILNTIGDAPPEHVARQFADAWCDPLMNCLVLHVPGRKDSPWIIPGGKIVREILKPDFIQQNVRDAKRRANLEPKEFGKIRAATTESADLLRIWMGATIHRGEVIKTEQFKMRTELEERHRRMKLLIPVILASTVLLITLAFVTTSGLKKLGPRHFPTPHVIQRLGAPYAGGNDASIDLSPSPARQSR